MEQSDRKGAKRKMSPPVPREDDLDGLIQGGPNRYRNLVNNAHMSDMTFVVGAQQVRIPGHSLIVGMSSSVLREQFADMNTDVPVIVIRNTSPGIWLVVLHFMYGHHIETMLTVENVLGCLKCALRFKLEDLRDKCAYFIRFNQLLLTDNIPVNMLDSVTITEAIELRYNIRSCTSMSVFTIQWRNPFVLRLDGVNSKTVRRLTSLNLRNLNASHMFNSVIAWFRHECKSRRMPREYYTLQHFLLNLCARLNFPAMTPGQFYGCVRECTEIQLSDQDIQQIRDEAKYRRRMVDIVPRRFMGMRFPAIQDPKSGIYEVAFLQALHGIQTPPTRDTYNRTILTIRMSSAVIIHGIAVPVPKDSHECVTMVLVGDQQRLLETTTASGMRRLFDANYDIQYIFLNDPIYLDSDTDYKISMRSKNYACFVYGQTYEQVTVNGITFFFSSFQQAYCHALFMLFENPILYPEANTMSMFDLVAYVRRFSSSTSSSSGQSDEKNHPTEKTNQAQDQTYMVQVVETK
ncbi:hypothetical protein DMENIID0001_011150 [Sergentomyia squamirostris]